MPARPSATPSSWGPDGWGPNGCSAAVSVTFDNFGEAAELELGLWPQDKPIGHHSSVTDALPAISEILKAEGLRSTFFVEGWNTDVYPAELALLHDGGHEIAYHAWRHEAWNDLASAEEQQLLEQGRSAFAEIGIDVHGFRPPGGRIGDGTLNLLKRNGFYYCSPAGHNVSVSDDVVILPFGWQAVDAYYYMEQFAPLRRVHGEPDATLKPANLLEALLASVETCVLTGGYLSIIFHPFLNVDSERLDVLSAVVQRIASDDRIWSTTCQEIADWVLTVPHLFPREPLLDERSWA